MHLSEKAYVALAGTSLAAWIALALYRGRFWSADVDRHLLATPLFEDVVPGTVAVVVPARDEAETIGAAVASLVGQCYPGPLSVTLVDDDSHDGTRAVAVAGVVASPSAGRLTTIAGRPLEPPWTGKLNALDAGVADVVARNGAPDFWLFTDADIEHAPTNVAQLVAKMERDDLDLVSSMVRLRCESAFERLLVPAFIYFFAKLYPFSWSNDRSRSTAAAAGGCVLIRASALERIGGLASIGDRLIDDCALAAAVKASGGATWIGLTAQARSIRRYGTLEPFWAMVKRSAFTQLGHSYGATLGATLVMGVLYIVPPALLARGMMRRDVVLTALAAGAWAVMAALYGPTLRAYRLPFWHAVRLPAAAALYMTMTLDSALAHAIGRGGAWKGRYRTEPPRPLT